MTAQQQRLKPIGFWSYARQDDEASDGRLSQLRGQLARELQQVYGRDPIQLWQDVAAIPPGAEWEKAIDDAIAQSTFLIPIITPAFVESEFCCREVAKFFQREAEINAAHPELQGQRRIFPIVYIDAEDSDPFDPATVAQIKKFQFVDFRQLREDDDPQQIRKAVVRLAGEIARLLKIKVTPAPTPEELEEQRRRQEQSKHEEQTRKEKEKEEARQKVEAEKREADQRQQQRLAEEQRQREARERRREENAGAAWATLGVHRFKIVGALCIVLAGVMAIFLMQNGREEAPREKEVAATILSTPSPTTGTRPGQWLVGDWVIDQAKNGCSRPMNVRFGTRDGEFLFEFPKTPNFSGSDTFTIDRDGSLKTSGWRYTRSGDKTVVMQAIENQSLKQELSKCAS